jgi:predicted dehydrogenase
VKILLIGLGGIGQRHARNLRTLLGPDLDLIAYRARALSGVITPELRLDSTRSVEREYNVRRCDTLNAALGESPDIAFVCNPSSMHMDTALQCAAAGCDLFIEKPLSHNLTDVYKLIDSVAANHCIATVGYQMRFHPSIQQLRAILSAGAIGQPLAVRGVVGEFLPSWHGYEDYRTMYASRSELGGGVILSQIHEFDYLYAMFGLPMRVFAIGGHWSSLEIDVEDTASIMLECATEGRALPVHVQLDYLQNPPIRRCEVVGDQGKVSIDLITNETILYAGRGSECERTKPEKFERNQLFVDELKLFLECVETRRQPIVTLQDGVESLRIALAAKQSIATGRVVTLESVESKREAIEVHTHI